MTTEYDRVVNENTKLRKENKWLTTRNYRLKAAIARVKKLHRTKEHFMHASDVLAALKLRK